MRALLYVQHLSGVGHYVRMYEIARALAAAGHDAHLVDGGRVVPRRPAPITLVPLPRIHRAAGGIAPADAMPERRRLLLAAVDRIRPDVVLVEHFPFSKWSLRDEVVALLERTSARVFCSLRDIAPTHRDIASSREKARVLQDHFDAILVHADPRVCRLDVEVPVPVTYTGYVSETPSGPGRGAGRIVVSAGGAGGAELRRACAGLDGDVMTFGSLSDGFAPDFLDWMNGSALSISRAGYNTCMNVLATRTRAILVPDPEMSDQPRRARLLEERGLATVVESGDLGRLRDAVAAALAAPPPEHDLDLDGARATARLVTELA